MTPKPANLPPVEYMTPAQIIAEAARVLRNAGGERYGAGYSARLADALEGLHRDCQAHGAEAIPPT